MVKNILKQIYADAKKHPKTIVFPEGDEPRVLKATQIIVKNKLARPVLLGDADCIKSRAKQLKVNLNGIRIIDPKTSADSDAYAKELYKLRKKKGMTLTKARETIQDLNYYGTMMVHIGDAHGLVSGSTHSTADTVRPALQIIKTKEKFHKISSVFLMMLENRLLFFADCAVMIDPDAKDLAEIAIDTSRTARAFGILPKVAMLSFSTNGSAKHPAVDKVKEATAIVKDKQPNLIVDGEMQVDSALVRGIGMRKFPGSELKGDANVLIFPDLNTGNVAYKLVERLAKAKAIGPILQGLRKPVNDLSRGCSVEDIVNVTAITAVEAQKL